MKTIQHYSLAHNWNQKQNLDKINILILGSFNPFNPSNKNHTDFYYGRESNYFWKTVAEILRFPTSYFTANFEHKKEVMNKYSFSFFDIINSIEINTESNNKSIINEFINEKIFQEFSDQVLFTTKTNFNDENIYIKRNYNHEILTYLKNNKINKVIHTLGNNTIDENLNTKWKEIKLKENGFQGYINQIKIICKENNIEFVSKSYSPSAYAVKRGGDSYSLLLKKWLEHNLFKC